MRRGHDRLSRAATAAFSSLLDRGRVAVGRNDAVGIPEATELVRAGLARWEAPLAAFGDNARVLRLPDDKRTAHDYVLARRPLHLEERMDR